MTDTAERGIGTMFFDHYGDAGLLKDPWARWAELQSQHRFLQVPYEDYSIWVMLDQDDVRESTQRWDLFSSHALSPHHPVPPVENRIIPAEIDPPMHSGYRQMILPFFAPARIEAMLPQVRAWVIELIEGFSGNGQVEFIRQFAKMYPTYIFMGIMGLPIEDAEMIMRRSDEWMHRGLDEESSARGFKALEEVKAYLQELVDDRRKSPREDVLTTLTRAKIADRPMYDHEIVGYSLTLYFGGLDTVAMELGHMFRFLAEHPAHRQQLLDDPALIPDAVEEFLRYYSIVTTGRLVTKDEDFHGCPMKAGDRMLFSTPAAGRDPKEFPAPDVVDFHRRPNRHLAFGAGPHRCLGSHLAREELVIALEEWHKRIPHYRIAEGAELHYHGGVVAGLNALPLVW